MTKQSVFMVTPLTVLLASWVVNAQVVKERARPAPPASVSTKATAEKSAVQEKTAAQATPTTAFTVLKAELKAAGQKQGGQRQTSAVTGTAPTIKEMQASAGRTDSLATAVAATPQKQGLPPKADSLLNTVARPGVLESSGATRSAQGGDPGCIATGPDSSADGYLAFGLDEYGSFVAAAFGGGKAGCPFGDNFNPAGAAGLSEAVFTNGFVLYIPDTAQRELLSTSPDWKAILDDGSLDSSIFAPNTAVDLSGDGVDDTLTALIRVFDGAGVDLLISVIQEVEDLGGGVSKLTQDYGIINKGAAIDFVLLRQGDYDLLWDPAADFANDSVGTGANGLPACDRFAFQLEDGLPETAITMSSPNGDVYYGSKLGIVPNCPAAGVPYGFGTDLQQWDEYGVPFGWDNHVAGVGCDTDGESGPAPAGCGSPCDGAIGLRIPVSLGPGGQTTVTIMHTYGSTCPAGCDCGGPECGDGVCDPGEDCKNCEADCGPCPVCGDGVVNQPSEECDPPDDAACPGMCDPATCQCLLPCELDCPPGALPEGEACGDDTNGGCNSDPVVFTEAECNMSFCGTARADGGTRDTDWYRVTVPAETEIHGTLTSQFPGVNFIVDGIPDCTPVVAGDIGCSDGCTPIADASACLPAGEYVVFVAPGDCAGGGIFEGIPCGGGNNDYVLEISCAPCGPPPGPENDNCQDAAPIECGATAFDTTGADTDGQAHPACDFDGQTYHDIWYEFIAPQGGVLTVSTCNQANYDTDLVVYDGCDPDDFMCPPGDAEMLGCNDDAPGCAGFSSEVTVPVLGGNCYTIRVGGFQEGDQGTGTVTLSGPPCEVPVGACCLEGGDCLEDVTAEECAEAGGEWQGEGTPCFTSIGGEEQWFESNPNLPIPDNDATGASDTITVPGPGDVIGDVDVDLSITHTWVGDLCVSVEHNGTTVILMEEIGNATPGCFASGFGCSEDNFVGIVLDDEGTGGAIESQCVANLSSPPNYTPQEALSAFDGMDKAGDWTITVVDSAGADTGTLDTWSLHITAVGDLIPVCLCATNEDCDDGNACTIDECLDGECFNTPAPLSTSCEADEDLCTIDHCDGNGACVTFDNVVCQSPDPPCEGGEVCNPVSGVCDPLPDAPLSTPCEADEDLCTIDHCDGNGACVTFDNVVCQPPDPPCEGGEVCNPVSGVCDPLPDAPLSTPCEGDGNVCTGEHCDGGGNCVPFPPGDLNCDDGDPCNGLETCDPILGCQPGIFDDCNNNGIADECEVPPIGPLENDCNGNGIPDDCDIADCPPEDASCQDCDDNGVPDECQLPAVTCGDVGGICTVDCDPDCNGNCVIDSCDISQCPPDTPACDDCNINGVPDECDIDPLDPDGDGHVSDDTDGDGVPDECVDCTGNCIDNPVWSCP
ncbi:MAG: proprotein convertase P-domain-containing protein, partial [Phycisphaerae bacterium]